MKCLLVSAPVFLMVASLIFVCLFVRTGGLDAGAEMGAELFAWRSEPAGRGAHNAAPSQGGVQECLHDLRRHVPADEPSQPHVAPHVSSTGPLPGGTVCLRHGVCTACVDLSGLFTFWRHPCQPTTQNTQKSTLMLSFFFFFTNGDLTLFSE